MASFNVLGSSHTGRGGHSPGMASGAQRMNGALRILAQHQITVVGFQEFQPNQRAAFRSRARGWQMYPGLSMGRRAGENSVAWRTDTWEMVKPGLIPIPYFNGRIRPMPYVLLRNLQTGVQAYFSTFHNPANIGGNQARHRREATRRQIRLFNQLEGTGTPQFVTGDMNERAEYFCRVTGSTPLTRRPVGATAAVAGRRGPPRSTGSSAARACSGPATSSTGARSCVVRRTTRSWSPRSRWTPCGSRTPTTRTRRSHPRRPADGPSGASSASASAQALHVVDHDRARLEPQPAA